MRNPSIARGPAAGTGEVQACKAAAQGVSELRQYIQRTQGIHILYMRDFVDAVPAELSHGNARTIWRAAKGRPPESVARPRGFCMDALAIVI